MTQSGTPIPRRYVVLGGIRSGKSRQAGRWATALAGTRTGLEEGDGAGVPVCYVATGAPDDPELAERIEAHQRERPAHWQTLATRDIAAALRQAPRRAVVIVEDLEGWLAQRMGDEGLWTDVEVAPWGEHGDAARRRILDEAADWWRLAAGRTGATIVTAGQPGGGVIPASASVRRWVDLHGELVQLLSAEADRVELVIAGRALPLPPPVTPEPTRTASTEPAMAEAAAAAPPMSDMDLRDHGDTQVPPGAVDLAVNVLPGPPRWLRDRLGATLPGLAGYPDLGPARQSAAARHGRPPQECLPLNGAAEAFWLLAQVLRPRLAACVHPSFTEGEAALRSAGTPVTQVFRNPDTWTLDPTQIPEEAELVMLGRPDNPTGIADEPALVAALCRPGRTVVLDEAFADFLPDGAGLAGCRDLPGLVVLRSLTKLWGMAGLRVGYLLGEPGLVARLAAARQPWPLSSLALTALAACTDPAAEPDRRQRAERVARHRESLLADLRTVPGLRVWPGTANFLLLHSDRDDLRQRLLTDGLAVRRGDPVPGLDSHYVRVAVTTPETGQRLTAAVRQHLKNLPSEEDAA